MSKDPFAVTIGNVIYAPEENSETALAQNAAEMFAALDPGSQAHFFTHLYYTMRDHPRPLDMRLNDLAGQMGEKATSIFEDMAWCVPKVNGHRTRGSLSGTTKTKELLRMYDEVHAALEGGKDWSELTVGPLFHQFYTYDEWLGWMQQSILNELREINLRSVPAEHKGV